MHLKKLIASLCFLLAANHTSQTMNLEYFKNMASQETIKTVGVALGAFCLINPQFCNFHELCHGLTVKALFNLPVTYKFEFLPWKFPAYDYDKSKVPLKGLRRALLHASGTVGGLAAIYAASKCVNIGIEYYGGQSLIEAVSNGLQKSFFSCDQHFARRLVCAGLITTQLANLIPFKWPFESDGYRTLKALNIIE